MAAFNVEIVPSRPLGLWGSAFMVEAQGSRERTVRREGCEEGSEPYLIDVSGNFVMIRTPRANRCV